MVIKCALLAAAALLALGITSVAGSSQKIDCHMLREAISGPRWLSVPQSRLVLNPAGGYDFLPMRSPVAEGFGPALPVNLAYWVGGDEPVKLPMFWSWQPSRKVADSSTGILGKSIDLLKGKPIAWRNQDVSADFAESGVHVTLNGRSFGHIAGTLTVDLDETPYLLISVRSHDRSRWALKVSDGTQAADTYLRGDTADSGDFAADVRAVTGWHGKKKLTVKLFVVGEPGASIDCSILECVGLSSDFPALSLKRTVWAPHEVVCEAECPEMRLDLRTTTFFPDESTIAQMIHVRRASSTSLILRGYFPSGKVRWDGRHQALVLESESLRAVIALNRPARWLGAATSLVKGLTGSLSPEGDSGMWALAVDGVKSGDDIAVVARFAPGPGATGDLVSQAAAMAEVPALKKSLQKREATWNTMLSRAPRPADFDLHLMKDRGITPEQIERTYYRAWVFLGADVLPPMPENGYPYPQLAAGKPSLWAEGHLRSRASAQWESMIAMLFFACIDSRTTWEAFEGMMSLVDANGTMGGEGLPSRHAQVAWTLYSETLDKERLRKCYPAIKRLLQWKIEDPRWIFKGLTSPGMKDIEFVVHDLMDMQYAGYITDALGMAQESKYWQAQTEELAGKFRQWFWETPSGPVYRIYDEQKKQRAAPDNAWCIPAIVLPMGILQQPEKDSLLKLFKSSLNPETPFMIWNLSKHPGMSFTLRGAWQYGFVQETAQYAESIMRDIPAAGEFSEWYNQDAYPPRPIGVTPSVFGATAIIDSALWHNGIMYGDGLPVLVRLPNASDVSNLSVRGSRIDVSFDPRGDGVTISGEGLRYLALPKGFHAAKADTGMTEWHGVLPVGGTLGLSMRSEPRKGSRSRP